MLYRSLVFLCLLILASCLDNKDYTLDSLTVTPTVAVPLASGNIGILDLVSAKDSTYIKVYSDGVLYFGYSQTLPSQDIRHLFDVQPLNSTVSFDLVPGSLPPSSSDTPFGTIYKDLDLNLSPAQLTEMVLKGGSLSYTTTVSPAANPALPLEVKVTLATVTDKNTGVPLSISTTTGSASTPLKDYKITLTGGNKFTVKVDLILKARPTPVFVPAGAKVNYQMTFNLQFDYIKGFFGDRTVPLPHQDLDVSVFTSSLKNTKVSILSPVINLAIRNDYGAPSEITFSQLEASKPGSTIPFQITPSSPINIGFPTALGTSSTTLIGVDNTTAIVNFEPTKVSYTATARLNKGLTTGTNFMSDTSLLKITTNIEIPLYGHASGITLNDTLAVDLGSVNQSTVLTAELNVNATNEMPFDAIIQLYMTDDKYNVLDSIFSPSQTHIVTASTVNATGELQTAGVFQGKSALSVDKLNKLFTSKYIIVKSTLNTTKDANGALLDVKFKSTYRLKLNLGLLAKLKITTK